MFGGVTTFKESLDLSIKKEIITLLMGPLTQIILVQFLSILHTHYLINDLTYEKINIINTFLLTFNLLPILPLDGGKLLNNILDLILPYDLSHKITIIIGIISLPILIFIDNHLFGIIIIVFLILNIIDEINSHKYRLKKLILERKLHHIKWKRTNKIKSIKELKRNQNFLILINGMYIPEYNYYELIKE